MIYLASGLNFSERILEKLEIYVAEAFLVDPLPSDEEVVVGRLVEKRTRPRKDCPIRINKRKFLQGPAAVE